MELLYISIQGVSEGNVSVLGGDIIDQCERNETDMNMCLIVYGYQDTAV